MYLIRDKEVEAVDGNYKHTLRKNTSWLPNTICASSIRVWRKILASRLCIRVVRFKKLWLVRANVACS